MSSSAAEFSQLGLTFIDPVQHNYEAIRPIVLFDESVSERSQQADLDRQRIGEKAKQFVQQGMLGLVHQRSGASPLWVMGHGRWHRG